MASEKLCKGACGLVKPETDFGINRANRRRSYCYPCDALRSKAWREAHPEAHPEDRRAAHNQWVRDNRDKANVSQLRWDIKNPEKRRAYRKKHYAKHHDQILERGKALRAHRKHSVIAGYGGHCVCCGESEIGFLTLDHVGNDGNAHRRAIGGTSDDVYRWAIANEFPSALQCLCFNCNMGRQHNGGICPHEETRLRLVA